MPTAQPGRVWAAEVCSQMSCSVAGNIQGRCALEVSGAQLSNCSLQALIEGTAKPDTVPTAPMLVSKPNVSKFFCQNWASQALPTCGGSLGVDPLICGPLPQSPDE